MNQYDTAIIVPLDTPFKENIMREAADMRMSVAALVRMKMSYCNKKYQKNDISERKEETHETQTR